MGGGAGASFKAAQPSQMRPAGPNENYPKFKSLETQSAKKDQKASTEMGVSGLKNIAPVTKVEGKTLKDRFAKFNQMAKKLEQHQVERENAHLDVAPVRFKESSATVATTPTRTASTTSMKPKASDQPNKERLGTLNKQSKSVASPRFRASSASLVKVHHGSPSKEQKERFAAFNKLAKKLATEGRASSTKNEKSASKESKVSGKKEATKLAPSAANAFYKKYAEKPHPKAAPTKTKMLDAAAINTAGASLIPRFSTQQAHIQQAQQVRTQQAQQVRTQQAQQAMQQARSGVGAASPGMMTFEYYDPQKPPPWLAPPWNRHEAGNNVNAMPQGLPQGMGAPAVQNGMIPNGGAAFGTNGAPGVPFAYAPIGQVNQQQFVGSPHLNAPPMQMRL